MSEEECICSWCGEALNKEERESPYRNSDDDPICDECYHDEYEFICEWCQEYGETEDQHNLLLVLRPDTVRMQSEEGYLQPGVYQIVRTPYFGSNYFDSWILWGTIERLCDLPSDIDVEDNWYPCGHLCLDCQNKIWEQIGAQPFVRVREYPRCQDMQNEPKCP